MSLRLQHVAVALGVTSFWTVSHSITGIGMLVIGSHVGLTGDPSGTWSHEYDNTVYCIRPYVKGT